ncbi:SDR family NAD(P)-dependent oxidoreductase [Aurantiacibacter poecillastricola]|uniref:SDR family NAD(P)-dependent oxidoreductase n=1 Tax=Aurantiacibacter poecillastricola TaxID=3064385 RepID=UPI00273FDC39|nr:SDR family NAD(P)-dependent oxidoreductase [Aurantiacibacter sp. 219JJ12-13]MDP5261340.1 SDR family NAD(P)-dependent oxidoreductase [Aurantiacibacter sp. 219JJ12-13]
MTGSGGGLLEGKVACITGAASGIGRASALLFASEGAKVVVFDRADSVRETAEAIREAGGEAIALTGDAGEEADVSGAVATAQESFGDLHVFFANAGITGTARGGFFDSDAENWLAVLRVNLVGAFLAVKHAAPAIEASGGGAIVCTASVAGLRSGAGPAPYSASKAGVINLVQTAAQQLGRSGVRINAVCPGLIETGMTAPLYENARTKGVEDRIGLLNPMGRGGDAKEIAKAALFLASDMSSYVNGQALAADGGLSTSHPVTRPPGQAKR